MKALVISGGGSKGAFAVGVLKYLVKEKGHDYGIIPGVTKAVDEFSATFNKQVLDLKSTTRAWYWIKD